MDGTNFIKNIKKLRPKRKNQAKTSIFFIKCGFISPFIGGKNISAFDIKLHTCAIDLLI